MAMGSGETLKVISDTRFEHNVAKRNPSVEKAKQVLVFGVTTSLDSSLNIEFPWVREMINRMDLVPQVKELLKTSDKHRWLNLGALFCVAQASGIGIPGSGWGLDPSWVWTTSQASREMLFQNKGYVWTYGPLGFLDFIPNDWTLGFVLSSLFAISSTLFLFYTTYFLWIKTNKDSTKSVILTILLTTFIGILTPPSLRLVFGMTSLLLIYYLEKTPVRNRLMLQSMAVTAALLFYLKIFPFTVFLIIVTGLIFRPNNLRKFQDYIFFVASLTSYIIGIAILLKFTVTSFIFWISGYLEMLTGYKAMGIEKLGTKQEYLFAFILILYILHAARRFPQSRFLLVTLFFSTLLFFTYGFTRHDIHSQTTFVWLTYLSIAITLFSRQRINSLITLLLLFTLPIQILSFVNFTERIQNGPVEIIKSLDSKYLARKSNSDFASLRNETDLSPQFLNLIQERTISILPWDQLIAKGYGFNFVTFPIPQTYSAYTPKLDAINARFVQGADSPDLILLNGPKAIDGRNPIWEAPLTNIAILCNYHAVLDDSKYLLLEKNKTSACDYTKHVDDPGTINNSYEYIETVELSNSSDTISKLTNIFFKRLSPEILQINGRNWNFVSANRKHLILNVPPTLDYPGKWKIGNSNVITKSQTEIRKQFVKVKIQE